MPELRRLALALALGAMVLTSAPAQAAGPEYPRYQRLPRIPKRIGVLSFRNFTLAPDDLFRQEGTALGLDLTIERLQAHLEARLASEDGVELVPARALRERLTTSESYRQGILLAREWFNLGVSHYQALRLDRALENLDRAQKLYMEVYQDVVEPHAVAEVELYRALTLAEQKSSELAHVALKRLFELNPWKTFARGYFAADTEQSFVAALVDFQLSGRRDLPLVSPERAERFLKDAGLDALLFAYAERDTEGRAQLQIVVFEGRPGRITFRDAVPLRGDESDLERVDRWASRSLSCVEWEHPRPTAGPDTRRWFIDVGFAESFALVRPTTDLFHDIGFVSTVSYQLSRSVDLYASVFVTTTLSDPNRDLMQGTAGVRATIGGGFTFRNRWLRFLIHPGLQFAYLGRRTWTHDPDCKFYFSLPADELENGPAAQVCQRSDINTLDTPLRLGLDLTFGADFFLSDELYLSLKTGISAYLFPFDETDVLNFPLLFQLGIGYAL